MIGHAAVGTVTRQIEGQCGHRASPQIEQRAQPIASLVEAYAGLDGLVTSTPDFTGQPAVINSYDNVMIQASGQAGAPARLGSRQSAVQQSANQYDRRGSDDRRYK